MKILIKTFISIFLIAFTFAQNCPANKAFCTSLTVTGGTKDGSWSEKCQASVTADFASRDALEEFPKGCKTSNDWGPFPISYPKVTVPDGCDNTKWQQQRVLALIDKIVKMKLNYCHHHTPSWLPPASQRHSTSNTSGGDANSAGQCSDAGTPKGVGSDEGWKGIDCTTYTSFVFNYGSGCFLNALTGDQGCGTNAPGVALPYTASEQEKFLPGDILFIAKSADAKPLQLSHGVLWTGIQLTYDNGPFSMNTLMNNLAPESRKSITKYIEAQKTAGKPVFVISDSHYAGPNYRPFIGWYSSAFSHARRLINPDMNMPKNLKTTTFDGKVCVNNGTKSRKLKK
jgi:hypothetical protein